MEKRFEVGKVYASRSACDHEAIFKFTILARTAKTVTVTVFGNTVKRGISVYNGVEQFKPHGSYSMAVIISADRTFDAKPEPTYNPPAAYNSSEPVRWWTVRENAKG